MACATLNSDSGTGLSRVVCKEEGETGVASDGSRQNMDALTLGKPWYPIDPGETLGTLYNIGVGSNETRKHPLALIREP